MTTASATEELRPLLETLDLVPKFDYYPGCGALVFKPHEAEDGGAA